MVNPFKVKSKMAFFSWPIDGANIGASQLATVVCPILPNFGNHLLEAAS